MNCALIDQVSSILTVLKYITYIGIVLVPVLFLVNPQIAFKFIPIPFLLFLAPKMLSMVSYSNSSECSGFDSPPSPTPSPTPEPEVINAPPGGIIINQLLLFGSGIIISIVLSYLLYKVLYSYLISYINKIQLQKKFNYLHGVLKDILVALADIDKNRININGKKRLNELYSNILTLQDNKINDEQLIIKVIDSYELFSLELNEFYI